MKTGTAAGYYKQKKKDRNYNKILQILLELGTTARYYSWRMKTRTKSSYYR